MDYLARREHSFSELKQKLLMRFVDAKLELVDTVLIKLREEKLQSDDRFAESYVRYRKSRGFAYLRVKSELTARRVSPEIIDKYLREGDPQWLEMAKSLLDKKLDEPGALEFGSRQHGKLARFLESRGFPQAVVRKALQEMLVY